MKEDMYTTYLAQYLSGYPEQLFFRHRLPVCATQLLNY